MHTPCNLLIVHLHWCHEVECLFTLDFHCFGKCQSGLDFHNMKQRSNLGVSIKLIHTKTHTTHTLPHSSSYPLFPLSEPIILQDPKIDEMTIILHSLPKEKMLQRWMNLFFGKFASASFTSVSLSVHSCEQLTVHQSAMTIMADTTLKLYPN